MAVSSIKKDKDSHVNIVKQMKDYSKEPVFVKKQEKAAAAIKKYGLPKSFTKKKKRL